MTTMKTMNGHDFLFLFGGKIRKGAFSSNLVLGFVFASVFFLFFLEELSRIKG